MPTPKERPRTGHVQRKRDRYRRIIPLELRHRFGGKTEFIRSLKTHSISQAEAEYERIARGDGDVAQTSSVQPVAPDVLSIDLAGLRRLAETGGDLAARAVELDNLAATLRARIALGAVSDEVTVSGLARMCAVMDAPVVWASP